MPSEKSCAKETFLFFVIERNLVLSFNLAHFKSKFSTVKSLNSLELLNQK